MPKKPLVRKKTVTIKDVQEDDWRLLIEIADTFNMTMAEMIHTYADRFRFDRDGTMQTIEKLRAVKQRQKQAIDDYLGQNLQKLERAETTDQLLDPTTSGTYITVSSVFGRCPKCGTRLDDNGMCPSCQLIPPEY